MNRDKRKGWVSSLVLLFSTLLSMEERFDFLLAVDAAIVMNEHWKREISIPEHRHNVRQVGP